MIRKTSDLLCQNKGSDRADCHLDLFTRTFLALAALFILLFVQMTAPALSQETVISRWLLYLHDSEQGEAQDSCLLRQDLEFPANYLGMKVRYQDVASGLPDPQVLLRDNVRAVAWWFPSQESKDPEGFWKWIEQLLRRDIRCLALGGVSPSVVRGTGRQISLDVINRALNLMGLRVGDEYSGLPLDIEVFQKDSPMVEFERKLDPNIMEFNELHSISRENRVFLKLRKKSSNTISDMVVATPLGGVIQDGFAIYRDPAGDYRKWRVNFFQFLALTLGLEETPRPDVTTLSGKRIMYSHVDGDGVRNTCLEDRKILASERLYRRVFKHFSNIPIAVSVITADVDTSIGGDERAAAAARRIMALPNVIPASHTMTHPLIWSTDGLLSGSHMELPQDLIEKRYGDLDIAMSLNGKVLLAYDIPGYTFDPFRELAGSCEFITRELLQGRRKCGLVFWSGDCRPGHNSLEAASRSSILAINGGDSRMDWNHPSYGYISPLGRRVGDQYQVFTSASNENLYTSLWTTDFGGFRRVISTFENTGKPIRVSPVNVYYHLYSGERESSVKALEEVYEWCRKQPLAMIPVGDYITMVHGFESLSISSLPGRGWRISNFGSLATIRFDPLPGEKSFSQFPDLSRSRGLTGYCVEGGALYLHLEPGAPVDINFLPGVTQLRADELNRQALPFLINGTAPVEGVSREVTEGLAREFSFNTRLQGQASFRWNASMHCEKIQVTAGFPDETDRAVPDRGISSLKAEMNGNEVIIEVSGRGGHRIHVRCGCEETSGGK